MTFSTALALYTCTTAVYYTTTPVQQCMSEQKAAAAQVSEPSSYALHMASRRNWRGEVVGLDYEIVKRLMRE